MTFSGKLNAVRALVELGANVDAKTKNGNTPRQLAVIGGETSQFRM